MAFYDVFNGDADGIMSLVQLRRAAPRPNATLITGRKRDVDLLKGLDAKAGDQVTVLDVSMRTNGDDLCRILDAGAEVFYVDHHNAGTIPDHPALTAMIDTSPEMCTAMLIDDHLNGAYRGWAVAAAFGDNFPKLARMRAQGHDLPLEQLERLGILVNYNGYGGSLEDLLFHPAELYGHLKDFDTPMQFLSEKADIFQSLEAGYESDNLQADKAEILDDRPEGRIIVLPDAASSRRISGVFGNRLAQENPSRAHAILTRQTGGFLVSIRAPLERRMGADLLALKFETGGGRAAAAGINHLPDDELTRFVEAFKKAFS